MGNSLLDITVFGRRAAESVMQKIPERRPGTLTGLKKFRKGLKDIQHPSPRTSPLLFPIASKMKFQLAPKPAGELSSGTDASEEKKQFREPPDPLDGRMG
jgi:hypothetical protein